MAAHAEDIDRQETTEWVEALDSVVAHDGVERAGDLLDRVLEHARSSGAYDGTVAPSAYVNTIPPEREDAVPRRPRARAPHPGDHPLERDGDRAARQRGVVRAGRAHRLLPVGRDALRGRLQPLLARAGRGARRRPRLHAGPLVARRLRPRVPRGPAQRGGPARLPPGGLQGRAELLPAPVADAGLLAVPDRLDGPRADHGDLPGALHEVPDRPRAGRHDRPQGVGVPGRRRDRRAGVAGRDLARRPPEPRQPRVRRQLQPAAPRRAGARQRQDHQRARDGLPRRGLERPEGDLGQQVGPAAQGRPRRAAQAPHGRVRRRRVPDLQVARRQVRARQLLRRLPRAGQARRGLVRRPRSGASTAAATTRRRSTPPTPRRCARRAARR